MEIGKSPRAQVIFWALMQLLAFAALEVLFRLERPFNPNFVHVDVQLYYNAAKNVLAGQVPYRDFFFPYPPAAPAFFIPPALISENAAQYSRLFEVETLIFVWGALAATAFIARRTGQSLHRTLLFYTLAIPAMGVILWQRYDLTPALLVVLAFAAWVARRNGIAWGLLALGTLVKIYPALLAPLFAIAEYRANGARRALSGAMIYSSVVVLGVLPFFIASFEATANTFFAQTGRGFEVESVGASLMIAASWFGFPAQVAYQRLNTWDVESPASGALQLLFLAAQVAVIAFVYWRFLRVMQADALVLIRYSVAVIALSLLTSKVFSPQFIVWLFPIALLSGETKSSRTAVLFLLAATLTQLAFPFLWQQLKESAPLPVGALLVRDGALLALAAIQMKNADKQISSITSLKTI